MFKVPFSFDGRIRRIEYFLSGIVGGIVFSIAWALGIGTFIAGMIKKSVSMHYSDFICCLQTVR